MAVRNIERAKEHQNECNTKQKTPSECPVFWLTTRRSAATIKDVENIMESVILNNNGWEAGGDLPHNRYGWLTETANSTFDMVVESTRSEISSLVFYSLVSYGPKWEGTEIAMTLSVKSQTGKPSRHEMIISAFHKDESSILEGYRQSKVLTGLGWS